MKGLKDKKEKDLLKLLHEKKKSLRLFRFSLSGGKTKNTKEGRGTKKEIAQILTEMNSRTRSKIE